MGAEKEGVCVCVEERDGKKNARRELARVLRNIVCGRVSTDEEGMTPPPPSKKCVISRVALCAQGAHRVCHKSKSKMW